MKKDRMWGKPAFAALLVLALGGAVVAAAAGGYGSQSDPLVTLSYITDVAVPEANTQDRFGVSSQAKGN